jgi:hypothetical protein
VGTRVSFPRGKAARVKNVWNCTLTCPCVFMVYSLIKKLRDNFTLTEREDVLKLAIRYESLHETDDDGVRAVNISTSLNTLLIVSSLLFISFVLLIFFVCLDV